MRCCSVLIFTNLNMREMGEKFSRIPRVSMRACCGKHRRVEPMISRKLVGKENCRAVGIGGATPTTDCAPYVGDRLEHCTLGNKVNWWGRACVLNEGCFLNTCTRKQLESWMLQGETVKRDDNRTKRFRPEIASGRLCTMESYSSFGSKRLKYVWYERAVSESRKWKIKLAKAYRHSDNNNNVRCSTVDGIRKGID